MSMSVIWKIAWRHHCIGPCTVGMVPWPCSCWSMGLTHTWPHLPVRHLWTLWRIHWIPPSMHWLMMWSINGWNGNQWGMGWWRSRRGMLIDWPIQRSCQWDISGTLLLFINFIISGAIMYVVVYFIQCNTVQIWDWSWHLYICDRHFYHVLFLDFVWIIFTLLIADENKYRYTIQRLIHTVSSHASLHCICIIRIFNRNMILFNAITFE